MRTVFITNLPSPYRVDFFNELAKSCELTVLYERSSSNERDDKWKNQSHRNYKEIYCHLKPTGVDTSIGLDLISQLKKLSFDRLIITGYSSPSVIFTILYCQIKHIPYFLEDDGAVNQHKAIKHKFLKHILISKCCGYFTTTDYSLSLVESFGVDKSKIFKYPFSSTSNKDIIDYANKLELYKNRTSKKKRICSVGQFIPRKGFDVLIQGMEKLGEDYELFIIGGKPSEEYLSLISRLNLKNIHFLDFCSRDKLFELYREFDLFVLPTRMDIWGLVVNEAMANGLPVVTSDMCGAGLEMIENGSNGYIFPSEDIEAMVSCIKNCFINQNKILELSEAAIEKSADYTIEKMVQRHLEILKK